MYTGDRRDSPHSIKKLLSCVSSYVTFKMFMLREALPTLRASERPLSSVNPLVIHKALFHCETLSTLGACERFLSV